MQTTSQTPKARTIPSVRAQVYRFVLDVLQSGHAMERGTYRYY